MAATDWRWDGITAEEAAQFAIAHPPPSRPAPSIPSIILSRVQEEDDGVTSSSRLTPKLARSFLADDTFLLPSENEELIRRLSDSSPTHPAPPKPMETVSISIHMQSAEYLRTIEVAVPCAVQHCMQLVERKMRLLPSRPLPDPELITAAKAYCARKQLAESQLQEKLDGGVIVMKKSGVEGVRVLKDWSDICDTVRRNDGASFFYLNQRAPSQEVLETLHEKVYLGSSSLYVHVDVLDEHLAPSVIDRLQTGKVANILSESATSLHLLLRDQETKECKSLSLTEPVLAQKHAVETSTNRSWELCVSPSPTTLLPLDAAPSGLRSYDVESVLGEGSFGMVWCVRHRDTGQQYALKVAEKVAIVEQNMVEHIELELEILRTMTSIASPYIVHLKEAFQSPSRLFLVMECLEGGTLYHHLSKSPTPFPESVVKFYAAQIVVALCSLHEQHFVYRDLKLENIILDANGILRLTDFGLSHKLVERRRVNSCSGTLIYVAPEIICQLGHDYSVDWWAFGILLFIMLTQEPPFWADKRTDLFKAITKQKVNWSGLEFVSPTARSLIDGLLHKFATQRFGPKQVKQHPFFLGTNWAEVEAGKFTTPIPIRPGARPTSVKLSMSQIDKSLRESQKAAPVLENKFTGFYNA